MVGFDHNFYTDESTETSPVKEAFKILRLVLVGGCDGSLIIYACPPGSAESNLLECVVIVPVNGRVPPYRRPMVGCSLIKHPDTPRHYAAEKQQTCWSASLTQAVHVHSPCPVGGRR